MNFKRDLKLLIIGRDSTNKNEFVLKWTNNETTNNIIPSKVYEFGFKMYEHEGKIYRIQLWDLAGEDKNSMVTKIYSKDAHGAVIMGDATNIQDRENLIRLKKILIIMQSL